MASYDLAIRQNDTTPALTQTILDATGAVQNLTGASVKFIMRSLTATTPQVNATATITDATNGKVSYAWSAADTATAGLFQGVFRVTLSGGGTYTFPNDGYLDIWVEEDLTTDSGQLLVSVADAKDYLNIPATDRTHDQKINRFVRAVRPVVEAITGPIIATKYDEWYAGGHYSIRLRRRPVLTLSACSIYLGPAEYPMSIVANPSLGSIYSVMLDPTGWLVRRGPGGSVLAFPSGPQTVHVVYTAGQPTLNENVRLGTLELLRINYQETQQGGRPQWDSSPVEELVAPQGPPTGFFVPGRVRQLLQPNRRAPSIA